MDNYTYYYHPESDSYWVHEGPLSDEDYWDQDIALSVWISKVEFLKGIKKSGQENDFPEITNKRKEENIMTVNDNNTTKVVTGKVRLSYVALLEAKAFEGQEPKFSTVILIPKSDKKTVAKIKKAQKAAYEGAKDNKLKGVKFERLKTTLRDGDDDDSIDLDNSPEYADHYFMAVSSKTRPGIIDKYKNAVDSPDEVYSGVYALVSLNFYAYNTAGNKGVTAGLNNVMVVAPGDYLGGRASAESDFADIEFEDEYEDDEDLM